MPVGQCDTTCVAADLARDEGAGHDPAKLAIALRDLLG
jgi:hypothetical protein